MIAGDGRIVVRQLQGQLASLGQYALSRRRLAVGRHRLGLVDQEDDEVLAVGADLRRGGSQGFLDLDGLCEALEGLGPTSSIQLHPAEVAQDGHEFLADARIDGH